MSRKKTKRFLSILLTMFMVLAAIPATTMPVFAGDDDEFTKISENHDLKLALGDPNIAKIMLTDNIDLGYKYDEYYHNHVIYWTNDDTKNQKNGMSYKSLYENTTNPKFYVVRGKKEIDLNGYTIELTNNTRYNYASKPALPKDFYVFEIEYGNSLHIYDGSGGSKGKVYHDGSLDETAIGPLHFGGANLFKVHRGGELAIDSGTYQAGRSSKTWCVSVHDKNVGNLPMAYKYYNGWAYNMLGGAVVYNNGGKVFINGGEFSAYGSHSGNYQSNGVIVNQKAGDTGAQTVINGGTFKGVNKNVIRTLSPDDTVDIKGGTFTTQKLKMRYATQQSYSLTWYVDDVQPYLGMDSSSFNELSEFKYDGSTRTYAWMQGVNFKASSKKLEVLPGLPSIELYDGDKAGDLNILERINPNDTGSKKYDCVVAKGAEYTVKAHVEPYFEDLGLGRKSELRYIVLNSSKGTQYDNPGENHKKDELFILPTETTGLNSYAFMAREKLSGSGSTLGAIAYFDAFVVNAPKPVVTILADKNPVDTEEKVVLSAIVDKKWTINKYEWFDITNGKGIAVTGFGDGRAVEYTAPDTAGEVLIQCTVTDSYEGTGTDIFRLRVGGDGTGPRIITDELVFKYNQNHNGLYVENIGGYVDNNKWEHISGDLPTGLSFVRNLGLAGFRGTPKDVGTFPVTIKATNGKGTAEKRVNVIVTAPLSITTNEILPAGVKGEEYVGETLQVSGGGDVKWSVTSGTLPKGMELNINTGEITGEPVAGKPDEGGAWGGEYNFTVKAEVTGEIPATKEFSLFIHEKPQYPASPIEISVVAGKANMIIKNPLDTKGTGEITYGLTGMPGFYMAANGDIMANYAPEEGTYNFNITATGYDDHRAEATVKLTSANAPAYSGGFPKYWVTLPIGITGHYYTSGDAISSAITPTNNPCVWEFIERDDNNEWIAIDNPLPAGLTLDPQTGVISGIPSQYTGNGSGIFDAGTSVYIRLRDMVTGLHDYILAYITIVDGSKIKAPNDVGFTAGVEGDGVTPKLENSATGTTSLLFMETIGANGIPRDSQFKITKGRVPDGINFFSSGAINGLPTESGTFKFTVEADNGIGKYSKELTIVIKTPEKAAPPVADPAPGTYKGMQTIKLQGTKTETVTYSVDGQDFKMSTTQDDGKYYAEIEIEKDTTIRAYTDAMFGLMGSEKANSDVKTYRYFIEDDDAAAVVNITTNSLSDGTVGVAYTENLIGTVDGTAETLNWFATGLPDGMAVSPEGLLSGTPTRTGNFTVKLVATTEDKTASAEKTLTLQINANSAVMPTISSHPAGKTYGVGATEVDKLTVEATVTDTENTLSYIWYESDDNRNDTPADDRIIATGDEFTPGTASPGERYYYAVAVNSKEGYTDAKAYSNVAAIKVTFDAADPYFHDDDKEDRKYLFTQNTTQVIREMANVDDEGTLFYQWFKKDGSEDKPVSGGHDGILSVDVGDDESEVTYYAKVTNTNNEATGNKTAGPVISPGHVVTATNKEIYQITFNPQTGEKAVTLPTNVDGKLEQLPEFERDGYELKGWFTEESDGTKITLDTYKAVENEDENAEIEYVVDVPGTVFEENTTVYAQWTVKSSGGSGGSGGTTPDPVDPETPDPGDGDKPAALPFIDVKKADWFYDDVYYAYFNKLMMGTSETTFSPHGNTTRGMIVAILHRLEGSPKASLDGLFGDVNTKQYYAEPIAWAAANNIVSGYSSDKFGPEDSITREQMAVILMNYAKFKGYDVKASADLTKFSDGDSVSSWAAEAMSWANAETLIQGSGEKLMPLGKAERAQVAGILHRFILKNTK